MRWWGIYHIQRFWVQVFWNFYHTIQSDVRYYIMHCGSCIYRLLMMSPLNRTIFSVLFTSNKAWSNYVMNGSVVSFIFSIEPWCITTSSLHINFYSVDFKPAHLKKSAHIWRMMAILGLGVPYPFFPCL